VLIDDRHYFFTLTLTESVLPIGSEKDAVAQLSNTMLKYHGPTGNKVMVPGILLQEAIRKYNIEVD
jgi:hypothetical protein